MTEKKITKKSDRFAYQCLEQVVGCKWSVSVLQTIRSGINRPGAIERAIEGISTKVLTERLRRLTDYGLLKKHSFPEVPPRTEYELTAFGLKLTNLIEQIRSLDNSFSDR